MHARFGGVSPPLALVLASLLHDDLSKYYIRMKTISARLSVDFGVSVSTLLVFQTTTD